MDMIGNRTQGGWLRLVVAFAVATLAWMALSGVDDVRAETLRLDPSFSRDGLVVGQGYGVHSSPEVFLAGKKILISNFLWALDRFNENGEFDHSFGNDGGFYLPETIYSNIPMVEDVELVGSSALMGGWFSQAIDEDSTGDYRHFFVRRLNWRGRTDRSFGDKGRIPARWSKGYPKVLKALALSANGSILTAGGQGFHQWEVRDWQDFRFKKSRRPGAVIRRFRPDGSLDRKFGRGGSYVLFGRWAKFEYDEFTDIEVRGGRILAVGYRGGKSVLTRLLKRGAPDRSFGGGDGIVEKPVEAQAFCYTGTDDRCNPPVKMAITKNGRIYVLDFTYRENKGTIARLSFFSKNGRPIRSFGHNGVLRFPAAPAKERRKFAPVDFALDPHGRVVLAGSHIKYSGRFPPDSLVGLVRLKADGSRDQGFGNRGLYVLPVGGFHTGMSLTIDHRGRFYVAGLHDGKNCAPPVVARLIPGIPTPTTINPFCPGPMD